MFGQKNFKNMMTPEDAYKHGYEDGLKAGREASFFEVEPDKDLEDLPMEDRIEVMFESILAKREHCN